MGSPPEPAVPAYRTLRLLWKQPQVLGVDLNRSELDEHDRLAPMRASIGAGGRVGKLEGSNLRGAAAPQKSNSTVFSRLGGDLGQKNADSARFWRYPEAKIGRAQDDHGKRADSRCLTSIEARLGAFSARLSHCARIFEEFNENRPK
jgi:hypothetical protein